VSEELDRIARRLKSEGLDRVRNIRLDNTWFTPGLVLDGTERSLNPYDAYNGALCVNFNTIHVRIGSDGRVESAEPQTPLTDMARELALDTGATGRIRFNLADDPHVCLVYAGQLLKAVLEQNGVVVDGRIEAGRVDPDRDRLVYRHRSSRFLSELVADLLEYSNNFMTNQVFLALGAEVYGPPATPEKARAVVDDYFLEKNLPAFYLEEGSGLSRKTRLTARQMMAVLEAFEPYRRLLPRKEGSEVLYKTGTLSDVKSVVGYVEREAGPPARFVVILNGPTATHGARADIFDLLEANLGGR
jgi:D-alanyl-D-alanine carboxypeptidase/D-alanyl-D-alanine-endopeptidase (penicillin-binding protein 4)